MSDCIITDDIFLINGIKNLFGFDFIERSNFFIIDFDFVTLRTPPIELPLDKELIGFASNDISFYKAEKMGVRFVLDKRSSLKDLIVFFTSRSSAALYRPKNSLTSREKQLIHLICNGHESKYIADELKVTEKTIYTFRRNIMQKIGCKNRVILQNLCN